MKKIIAVMLAFAIIISMALLSGCSSSDASSGNGKQAVCFLIANTANSQGLNFNNPDIQEAVYDTIRNYGFIAVVNVDGNPETEFAGSFDIEEMYKNASQSKLDMDAKTKSTNFMLSMQSIIANDEEVDFLSALTLGVREIGSLKGYSSKKIFVLGTGLSTSGVLDFRNNLLSGEADTIVDMLEERKEIPDFTGVTVEWLQLGDVAAPQQSLTSIQRKNLNDIYEGIVTRGGGEYYPMTFIPNPVDADAEYPAVSTVDLPSEAPIRFDVNETSKFSEPVALTEEQVCFIPDKAEYLKPEEAEDIIKPIAEYMLQQDTDLTLLLVGCIAGDTNSAFGDQLSQDRADKVKSTLIDFGVPNDRLITKGLGCSDPWHISGAGYEGTLASQNRKVVLLDATSETAKEII